MSNPCPLCDKDLDDEPDAHGKCMAEAEVAWIGYDEGEYRIVGPNGMAALRRVLKSARTHGVAFHADLALLEDIVFLGKNSS